MSRPRCARRARAIAQTYSGAANQATEAWVAPAFANAPRRAETGRNGGSVFPLRRSVGRLYTLNRADCLHDRKPVPVHPEVADLPVLHLIPRTGSRLPPFASWSDPAKVALVRRGRAHSNGDKIALGNHMLYGHFEVGKCLDGAGSDLPQALIRDQFFDVRRIVLDEHLIDEAQNDGFVLLG